MAIKVEQVPALLEVAEAAVHQAGLQQGLEGQTQLLLLGLGGLLEVSMVAVENHGVRREIVGGAGEFGVDQGHIAVPGGEGQAAAEPLQVGFQGLEQGLVWRLAALLPRNPLLQAGSQTGRALRVEARQGLRHRQDGDGFDIFGAALGHRVEIAHGVHLVAEELYPDRAAGGGRKDVENAAAQGKLAGALHQRAAGIAQGRQPVGQFLHRAGFGEGQGDSGIQQRLFRDRPHGQGLEGGDLDGRLSGGEAVELAQPLLLPAAGDGGGVVEGQVPGGQDGDILAQEAVERLLHGAGGHVVLAEHQGGTACVPVQSGDEVGPCDGREAGEGSAAAGLSRSAQLPVLGGFGQDREKRFHGGQSFLKAKNGKPKRRSGETSGPDGRRDVQPPFYNGCANLTR